MRRLCLLVCVLSLSCLCMSAGPILTFTSTSGDYVAAGGDATDGWSFSVVSPITVTQLMWYDPTGSQVEAHQVGIYSGTGTGPLLQGCVGSTCQNGSVWDSLTNYWTNSVTSTPFAVGDYVIGGKITLNEKFVWFADSVATDPAIVYSGNRYHAGGIAITYPESVLANPPTGPADLGFFGPNFGTAVPEPSTLTLLGAGLVLVGALRKKFGKA